MSQKRKQQSGFTLIELLIALTISSVISVIAYQAVSSVVTLQTRTEKHAEQMETLQRAMWWMEQDFIQLAPRTIRDGLGAVLPAFQYRDDLGVELTRIAEFPTPYGAGGLLRVAYQLEDNVLYRLVWPVLDRAPDTEPTKLPVLQGVEAFEIRLLNAKNQYVTSWPSEEQALTALPKLTEVRIQLEEMGEFTRLFMGAEIEALPQASATEETNETESAPEESVPPVDEGESS
ncbi:MAG: type II secretion system minor pseudopilin GspJ [Pseudomonadota bacterium]|nr:type II secretion system minor pseudopilin GspJ [Pseudomonadota bacterium]